jgi:hypothetical protein
MWLLNKDMPLVGVSRTEFVGHIFDIAKVWNIPFEELCSFLVANLGKPRLRRLVNTSDVLKNYGKECLSTWNEVIKS